MMTPDQREEWEADVENDKLAELYEDDPMGFDAPVFEDEPEEFGAPIGDVSGPALLEILVALNATNIRQAAHCVNFQIGDSYFAIEDDGELWGADLESVSLLSEKIRRAARERVFAVVSGS